MRIDSLPEQTSHHIINVTPTELARECGEENYVPTNLQETDRHVRVLPDRLDRRSEAGTPIGHDTPDRDMSGSEEQPPMEH